MPLPGAGPVCCAGKTKTPLIPNGPRLPPPGQMAAGRSQPPAFGMICSTPPPVLTLIDRDAAGSVAIPTCCGPPPLSAVSANGPPGTDRITGPPSLSTRTASGAVVNTSCAAPPSVPTVAVAAATPSASRAPPLVSACSGPVRPFSVSAPPAVLTVSGPSTWPACTGPPSESRFAAPVPETDTAPPAVATRTETPGGAVTVNATLHPETAHAGASRVRRPPETVSVTVGGGPLFGLNVIVSMTLTLVPGPAVTRTGAP